jgi:hypothetical protein
MEVNQIRQELTQVEQSVQRAAQAIQGDQAAPKELKDWVKEMETQTRKAKQTQDEETLTQCIEDMEATSDRAKRAVERSGNLGAQAKTAVMQTHQQLSELKHRLH